ncbi:MAG: CDP-alcohol phosphatidyltransferase family protein [Marinicellaceae bacterium]
MNWLRYLPNVITIGRIFAMIPLVWFMLKKQYEYALYIAVLAAFSDMLDGFLARRFGWEGKLGRILDPIADKFMMLCCYLLFAVQDIIPNWLLIVVLARDICIITGGVFYHYAVLKVDNENPSFLSKCNTALQLLLIVVLLSHHSIYQFHLLFIDVLIYLVTFFTVSSGLHYVYFWSKKAVIENDRQSKKLADKEN